MTLPDAPLPPPALTVGVATKDRPEALVRCLRSLRLLDGLLAEAIVIDDASDPPVQGAATSALAADLPPEVRFIRNERSVNVAAGRNRIVREARTPWVLNLDDDAFVVTREAVERGIRVLETDPEVAAIAFPQCDEAGVPYAPSAQPVPVDYPCYVPSFIGYAHLLRREAFLAAGGFRERLGINGEEKDLCLRMLDAGSRVVYLPGAPVGHVAAAAGRDRRRYLHQTVRNSVVSAFCGEPLALMPAGVAVRLWRYFPMRKGWGIDDPGGFGRIVRELARDFPSLVRERKPVRWETMRRWRVMTQSAPEPYPVRGVDA